MFIILEYNYLIKSFVIFDFFGRCMHYIGLSILFGMIQGFKLAAHIAPSYLSGVSSSSITLGSSHALYLLCTLQGLT